MPSITFDTPASGACVSVCGPVCTGEHTVVDKGGPPAVPVRYTIKVAYKKSSASSWIESDGELRDDGTWVWPKPNAEPPLLERDEYDFRATLHNAATPGEPQYKYRVRMCCPDIQPFPPPAAKVAVSTHFAITRAGMYNPAQGNYMIGVLAKRFAGDSDWVPVAYDRAELTCKPTGVEWRLTVCAPGKGRYLLRYLLIRSPGEVSAHSSEIITIT